MTLVVLFGVVLVVLSYRNPGYELVRS
jgi:hypothetical protein